MNIYKIAQAIQFANPVNVKNKISRMRETEFVEYIAVLSQIHENIQSGVELEDAIVNAAGTGFVSQITKLINEIGLSNFENTDFSRIRQALTDLIPAKDVPKSEQVIPGVSKAPVKPEPFVDVKELLSMKSRKRIEWFEQLEYPPHLREKAEIILDNLKAIDEAYSDKDTPRATKEYYEKELVSAMITLMEMAQGAFEEEEPEPEPEMKGKFKFDRKKREPSANGEESDESQRESNASATSQLPRENILDTESFKEPSFKEFALKSNNPYIDFSVVPPVFNEDMDLVFGSFLKKIEEIFQKAMSKGSITSLKQELNDLVFTVKTADIMTHEELRKNMKDVPKELAEVYRNIELRFLYECPSRRIISEEYFDTLYFTTLMLSAPKLGQLFLSDGMEALEYEATKNSHIQESDFDTIREKMELFAKTQFRSKVEQFFRLTSRHKERNFVDKVGLRWDIVFGRCLKKVYTQGPEYNLRPCPTCYKWVPWSYSQVAKKRKKEVEGFRVRLVSFLTNDREKPKVTLEELNSRKWSAPPSTIYSQEREQQLVIKYAKSGDRSWEEIQALLDSNNSELHEEGWHRRTGALYQAGGVFLNSIDLLIKNVLNECPFDTTGKAGSQCGVSFSPNTVATVLPKQLTLQPQWNGTKDVVDSNVKSSNTLIEDLWQDKDLYAKAKRLQSGGFKFSKINIACTCRIAELDSMASYKHSNIAISKVGVAGSPGFIYPTQPNGMLDTNLEDGTLSYMICGAPTSLSSFDRSPESSGFILKYLQRVRDTSVEDYQKLTTNLIRNGIDVQDIMELDQSLDFYIAEGLEKQTSTVQDRMIKLAELIKISKIELAKGSEKRQYLGGLTLVCPFGHKFNVEHSLQFAEVNAGISQKENIVKSYGPIITSQGENNLKAMLKLKYLIPADSPEMAIYANKMHYEEWSKQPNGVVFPDFEDPKRPLLLFKIPINLNGDIGEFVFYKKGQGWKDDIWESNHSYESARYEQRSLEIGADELIPLSMFNTNADASDLNVMDLQAAVNWEIDENNPVAEYDFNRPPTSSIPGASKLEDSNLNIDPVAFNQRIASFSRALKSVLRIITTWTKGLVSTPMINSMLTDYTIDISNYANEIITPIIPFITIEDLGAEKLDKESELLVIEDIKRYLVEHINRKGNNLYDWIRSNIYSFEEDREFDKQVAISIIVAAIKEFNNYDDEIGFFSDHGEAFMDIDTLEKNAKNLAKKIVDANPNLVKELTLKSDNYYESVRRKAQYNGRINMVGYAQYLATVLPSIYKKYCADEESYFYIGYNIGIDLSTTAKILGYEKDGKWVGGITEEQVNNITSSLKEAIEISGNFRKIKPQTLHYGHRIDRAWEELEAYLSRARKQAVSGRAMELSKSYIIERMSVVSGTEIEKITEKIANSFPTRSLLFNGTAEEPETGARLTTKRRLPFVSKDILFTDLPGSKEVDEWIVRNKKARTNRVFSSEAEARVYLKQVIQAHPEIPSEQWVVEPDPYWINENNKYDGSKMQIGIITPKVVQDFQWPPNPGDMDFAGINLPFAVLDPAADASMNKAKNFPIPSYRFEIEFDGHPLDISFLFRKGRTLDDENLISKTEKAIISATADSKRSLEVFKQQNADAIRKDPDILANATAQEEKELSDLLEPYLRLIDVLPLYLTTKTSYIDLTTKNRRPMIRLALEDPMRAYKLIMNPEVRGITLTPSEKARLVDFIIRVYNLDLVRDMARQAGGVYANLQTIDLFEKAETLKFKFLGKKMKEPVIQGPDGEDKVGWIHDAGEYFDLIPGEKNADDGSYLQYVYQSTQNARSTLGQGEHPDAKVLITQGEVAAIERRKMAGEGGEIESEEVNNEFAKKMEIEMLAYIKNRTSGERQNDVRDRKRNKKATEETEKISLRRSKLERSILSMGLDFDDVEVPQF